MSALTFTLKTALSHKLDASPLIPDLLNGKSLTDIKRQTLNYGGQHVPAEQLFDISGDDAQHIVFEGNCSHMDYIGANMRSGSITVKGDAGDFAACSMRGGLLTIHGNVGDFLGAGFEGLRKGMLGGTIIVKGNAGDRVGDQMRRGLILIEGNVGNYTASRMIAGTIGILGAAGSYLGISMRRGTLLLKQQPKLMATLQDCGTHTLPFLRLFSKSLAELDTAFNHLPLHRVRRFVGDAGNNGNGEILVINDETRVITD